jgi:NADPH:quinone reductase
MMRAVWLREFGGPETLRIGEAPDPVAGAGQVVIEVEFANITFVETQFRASGGGPFAGGVPVIPGNGVGGVVVSTGSGVTDPPVGARVVASTGGSGGYAERVAVAAQAVFPVPDGLATDSAVALLADGRTATMMVHAADLRPRERVLVLAAAGGVGSLLVQLAAAAGAVVVGAAGGGRKTAVAAELGAAVVVDYRADGWTAAVQDAVGGVDVVFDGVGGAISLGAFELLVPGGRMVSFGLASGAWTPVSARDAAARSVTVVRPSATPEELRKFTAQALADGAAGRLRPLVGQRFPLARAAAAHAAIEGRATVGKTLLEVR